MNTPGKNLGRHLIALLLLMLVGCQSDQAVQRATAQATAEELEAALREQDQLQAFYAARDYEPLWTAPGGPASAAEALLTELEAAGREGLAPAYYDVDRLRSMLQETGDPAALAELEVALSDAFLAFAGDLQRGRLAGEPARDDWHLALDNLDTSAVLDAVDRRGVAEALGALPRNALDYAGLREALARYRQIQADGGWPRVPGGELIEPGDRSDRVVDLRRRLAATGDLRDGVPPAGGMADSAYTVFDDAVVAALERFQRRHGLTVDGLLGESALAALNVPVEDRIRQIAVNLERMRWMPGEMGPTHVRVNIPAFRLYAYRGGELQEQMGVIVGKVMHETPVFADSMTHVIFGPYWNVPSSIAVEEILPKAQNDPGYLEANHYELLSGDEVVPDSRLSASALERGSVRIRQTPGPHNALGRVKFMFPNDYAIYLHDTPADHLFGEIERDFSHGCVRVERPADFADYVLENAGGWSMAEIESSMNDGNRERVDLDEPIPVYLLYLTAFVEDGQVQFREDLYGRDDDIAQALSLAPLTSAAANR